MDPHTLLCPVRSPCARRQRACADSPDYIDWIRSSGPRHQRLHFLAGLRNATVPSSPSQLCVPTHPSVLPLSIPLVAQQPSTPSLHWVTSGCQPLLPVDVQASSAQRCTVYVQYSLPLSPVHCGRGGLHHSTWACPAILQRIGTRNYGHCHGHVLPTLYEKPMPLVAVALPSTSWLDPPASAPQLKRPIRLVVAVHTAQIPKMCVCCPV